MVPQIRDQKGSSFIDIYKEYFVICCIHLTDNTLYNVIYFSSVTLLEVLRARGPKYITYDSKKNKSNIEKKMLRMICLTILFTKIALKRPDK